MTFDCQPVPHPDVEALAAFAEQELPEAEHVRLLEHLADCARCRELLFLAQQASAPFLVARPAALPLAALPPRRFSLRMTLLWSSSAIAAMLLLALTLRLVPGRTNVQTARLDQPKSLPAPAPAATPAAAPNSSRPPAPLAPPAPVAPAAASPTAQAARASRAETHAPPAGAIAELQSVSRAKSIEFEAGDAPAPVAERATSKSFEMQAETRAEAAPPARAYASKAVATAGKSLPPESPSAPAATAPSAPPALSSAQAGPIRLRLDANGALFFSHDSGSTWSPVLSQWPGHAVSLRTLSSSGQSLQGKPLTAPLATQPLFELTTDSGQLWISNDGRLWKRM